MCLRLKNEILTVPLATRFLASELTNKVESFVSLTVYEDYIKIY